MAFFTDREKSILKLISKHQRPQIAKANLSKRTMLEVLQYLTSSYITEPK
jgi:hypothetical protein